MQKNLYKEGYTQNRELSWLRFNDRVLNEAKDETVPLLERLKSVYFYTSNLTEFFRVRVGSLCDLHKARYSKVDNKSGLTPAQQLDAIYPAAKRGCEKRDRIFDDLRIKLAKEGIEDLHVSDCTKEEVKFLRKYYKNKIEPLLMPQIVDAHHPFPNLQNHITYIIGILKMKNHGVFCLVPLPQSLPSIIVLPHKKKFRYVHTEDVILANMNRIFPDAVITESMKLTVARSAYVDPADEIFEDIADYRKKMLKVLKQRKKMNVTMLTVSEKPSSTLRKYLLTHLKITRRELFVCSVPMSLKYVFGIEKLLDDETRIRNTYEPYEPKLSADLDYHKPIFDQIRKKDVLLHYPYQAMTPFLMLVKEAANDPDTVSIKITIYRMANHARLVDYLCQAAENGVEVDVLIELKARFDEQNNIDYSERLEDAGCNVTYGFERYKVHSKICLITKVKDKKVEQAVLISTGNFNENTAKSYTDMALMTGRASIIKDANAFFQNMAIGKLDGNYHTLLVAPVSLKSTLLELMDREIAKGDKGFMFVKVNSITDEDLIAKLSEASKAGVEIQMVVRGISCILPGVKGKTDNVHIRSVVGRYLEHSRIYVFGKGTSEKMYISSADFMTRNTERRVEIACPIMNASIRKKIHEYIDILMQDNTKARMLTDKGRYHKIKDGHPPFNSQTAMMRVMEESETDLNEMQNRPAAKVFHTKYRKKKK